MTLTVQDSDQVRHSISAMLERISSPWPTRSSRNLLDDWTALDELGWFDAVEVATESGPAGCLLIASVAEDFGRLLSATEFASLTLGATAGRSVGGELATASDAPIIAPASVHDLRVSILKTGEATVSGRAVIPSATGPVQILIAAGNEYLLVPAAGGHPDGGSVDAVRPRTVLHLQQAVATSISAPGSATEGLRAKIDAVAGVLVIGELLGIAQRAFDDALSWVQSRHQFARPIGSFQAVKHSVVDMYLRLEMARSLAYGTFETCDPSRIDIDNLDGVRSFVARSALFIIRRATHLHGGMGFTWENPMHVCYRRVFDLMVSFGGPRLTRPPSSRSAER